MSSAQPSQPEQVNASKARRSLRNGFITLILGGALAVGLLLAVPGLKGVATTVSHLKAEWVVIAVLLEVLSCASYVVAFLQVFERAPRRVGAQVALSEEAFGAAVSLGGVGSLAVGLEVLSCASYVVAFLQVFERAPWRVGARVALSEEAFGAAVSLGGAGSLAVGAWLMVERGAPTRRIAERSGVLFLYTSAINVVTLILAGVGLFLGLPCPSNPFLSIVPAAVGVVVLGLFLLLPRYLDRIVGLIRPGCREGSACSTAA